MSFKNIISGDVRYILAEKLECKDLWNLSKVVGERDKWIDLIHKKCLIEMKIRLKKILNNEYDKFMDILYKTGSAISDSFILQCLLNEDWKSDIDILVFEITLELEKFLKEFNFRTHYYNKEIRGIAEISLDKTITFGKTDFHFILVNNIRKEEIKEFICKNFDFDIIKNFFQENKLYIHDYEQIFSKRVEFKIGKVGTSSIRRVKYEYRGFTFYNKFFSYTTFKIWLDYKFTYAIPILLITWLFKQIICQMS